MLIHGSCHCGNISFRLDWQPEPRDPRACLLMLFLRKARRRGTSCPSGTLDVEVRDAVGTANTLSARKPRIFMCSNCGAVPLVTSQIDGVTDRHIGAS